jgi:RNA polymerase sigma-70 factor (ECF subfamily)
MNDAILNFDEIHEAYRPKIRRYLARMVGEDEAEDLTQEVFVKVHRSLEGFKGDSKFSTWIYRIATNAALDTLRSPSFQRSVECGPLPEDSGSDGQETGERVTALEQEDSSPERQVFRKQGFDCFRGILDTLPPNYRAVVALSELGDLAVEEIARILGLTPATVKIRLHRGRERLLRELKAHCRAEDWL